MHLRWWILSLCLLENSLLRTLNLKIKNNRFGNTTSSNLGRFIQKCFYDKEGSLFCFRKDKEKSRKTFTFSRQRKSQVNSAHVSYQNRAFFARVHPPPIAYPILSPRYYIPSSYPTKSLNTQKIMDSAICCILAAGCRCSVLSPHPFS